MPPSTEPASLRHADKAVRKYLAQHAEPEAALGERWAAASKPYAGTLVVPAYGEGDGLFDTLASVPASVTGRTLVIVVVNEPRGAPEWARKANAQTLARFAAGEGEALADHATRIREADTDVLVIDRTGPRAFEARGGVGRARKLGADVALGLWAHGGATGSWIHCSDADALLPPDYFDRRRPEAAALTLDFRHEGGAAILEYEIYLRYLVLGLHAANSPWAWHAIGSTLAIDARAYAQVRGFPRREAAEDFHLLAKLAKVGRIRPLRGAPIRLNDRVSERVPFGTGRAMRRAAEAGPGAPGQRAPDPRVYAALAAWNEALACAAKGEAASLEAALERAAKRHAIEARPLMRAAERSGLREPLDKMLSNRRDRERSLNQRFDALATLRWLHALRDGDYPECPLGEAIAAAPFLDAEARAAWPDLEAVRDALIRQERRQLR